MADMPLPPYKVTRAYERVFAQFSIRLVAIALGLSTLYLKAHLQRFAKRTWVATEAKRLKEALFMAQATKRGYMLCIQQNLCLVAIGHHANARAPLLRLVRRVRRRMRQREALIPTLQRTAQ